MGTEAWRPFLVSLLVEAYGKGGQVDEGLTVLAEALAAVNRSEERMYEAEMWRLRGELTLQKEFKVQGSKFQVPSYRSPTPDP